MREIESLSLNLVGDMAVNPPYIRLRILKIKVNFLSKESRLDSCTHIRSLTIKVVSKKRKKIISPQQLPRWIMHV
jgi:hypothetical protein